jgi:hypothetical protein
VKYGRIGDSLAMLICAHTASTHHLSGARQSDLFVSSKDVLLCKVQLVIVESCVKKRLFKSGGGVCERFVSGGGSRFLEADNGHAARW